GGEGSGGRVAGLALALARAVEGAGRPHDWTDIRGLLRKSADIESNEPLIELALDLTPHQQGVLITIDQAEELLTSAPVDATELFLRFLGRIASMPNGPFFVILTLRSDFLPAFYNHGEMRNKHRHDIHVTL